MANVLKEDPLKEAPNGFPAAVEFMNLINHEVLMELGLEVVKLLQYKIGAIKADSWCKKVQESADRLDEVSMQSVINALTYLFRSSAGKKLSAEEFTVMLDTSVMFTDCTRATLCRIWDQQGKLLQSAEVQQHILGVGQLCDIQWKVGMAMSSDQCRNLNSPYVTLNLTVIDHGGNLKIHTLELTMHQFRNFTTQLKEIAQLTQLA